MDETLRENRTTLIVRLVMFVASLRHNELILLCNCGNCVGLALKCILQNFTCLWVLRNIFFELWTRIQEREVKDS